MRAACLCHRRQLAAAVVQAILASSDDPAGPGHAAPPLPNTCLCRDAARGLPRGVRLCRGRGVCCPRGAEPDAGQSRAAPTWTYAGGGRAGGGVTTGGRPRPDEACGDERDVGFAIIGWAKHAREPRARHCEAELRGAAGICAAELYLGSGQRLADILRENGCKKRARLVRASA
ncbi:hypothetical protein OBBRIDRAFT_155971 [Obba rivulosa]|uniref:Uncharacterized protein n=1 Tax=Obba rivulosa TaxID=1052685 RepID=A0A8E2DGT5_9APHY|nr:hypothetical protein OBBRIDRAFT_155971 [Obba rivulosa]